MGGDGGSYMGLNVFGAAPMASSRSPHETSSIGNGDQATPFSSKPPTGRRSKSSTFDEFDPLIEEELMDFTSMRFESVDTPLRHPMAAMLPPRHHRDDPLLSKSRYRHPLQLAAEAQKHQQKSSKKKSPILKHRKSASLGGIGSGVLGNDMSNTCMFGTIANMEATKTPVTPLGMTRNTSLTSLECDGSIGPSVGGGASLGHGIGSASSFCMLTPGSVSSEQQVFTTPSPAEDTPTSDNKPEDACSDDSSYGSFSEELKRPDPKRKIVKNEFKHIFGKVLPIGKPVVNAGRKLMGRKNEDPSLKRAQGCLT